MDATQHRLTNFLMLFKQFREQRSDLPNRGMLKNFAEYLELSDRYLSHVKCGRKQIGSVVARQIETKAGKPHGWLDLPHTDADPSNGDERVMVEQILALYRNSPGLVRRLITDAVKSVLSEPINNKNHDTADDHPKSHNPVRSADRHGNAKPH